VLALDGAVAGEDAADDTGAADVAGWLVLPVDAAVLCGAEVEAAVGVEDDPQAVSSTTSDPSPAATAHRLLRMRSQPSLMSLAESMITCHSPPMPLPVVVSGFPALKVYKGNPL
jgi:hypothetical protein